MISLSDYEPLVSHDSVASFGAAITPGLNVMGSWTTVIGTPISGDYHAIEIIVYGISVNAIASNSLTDIGWDPAGGTNYGTTAETLIPYLNTGYASASAVNGGVSFLFPVLIPSGSTIGARGQTAKATVGTQSVVLILHKAKCPRDAIFGSQVISFGEAPSVSRGVDFSLTTAEGAWTLIASSIASPAPFLWIPSGCANGATALSADVVQNFELGFGPNATDVISAGERWYQVYAGSGEAKVSKQRCAFKRPAVGENIYIRGRSGSVIASTFIVHGVR